MGDPTPKRGLSAPVGFVKIDGVKGEATAQGHEGEIPVVSFELGAKHSAAPSKSESGAQKTKITAGDLKFVANTSSASPQLFIKHAYGTKIDQAVVTLVKPVGQDKLEYLTVTLTDVMISSYQASVAPGDQEAVDYVTLNYRKIEFEYTSTTKDHKPGTTTATSYDAATPTP